jgi:hypothetical protein
VRQTPTTVMIDALRILANDLQSEDGVPEACIAEAALRIEQMHAELESYRGCLQFIAAPRLELQLADTDAREFARAYEEMAAGALKEWKSK